MQLKGVYAPSGAIVGTHFRTKELLAVDVATTEELRNEIMPLRVATYQDIRDIGMWPPATVKEHKLIKLRMTPYGPVRQWGADRVNHPPVTSEQSYTAQNKQAKVIKRARRQAAKRVRDLIRQHGESWKRSR